MVVSGCPVTDYVGGKWPMVPNSAAIIIIAVVVGALVHWECFDWVRLTVLPLRGKWLVPMEVMKALSLFCRTLCCMSATDLFFLEPSTCTTVFVGR